MSDLVSVIMVVRNEEASIRRSLSSALSQTYADIEVLVVDGRSTDQTRHVVEEFSKRDCRVKLLDNAEKRISPGLNVGLRAARGKYVARLDGHSRWSPETLAVGVQALVADSGLGGVGGRRIGDATTKKGRNIAIALTSRFGVGNSIYHYETTRQTTDHVTNGVYRSKALIKVGGWDEQLIANEDVDVDFRIRKQGWRLQHEPEMLTTWDVRESISALFRQYRRYGRAKYAMIRKNGRSSIRLRHLAPPVLVVGSASGAIYSIVARNPKPLAPATAYGCLLVLAAAVAARSDVNLTEPQPPNSLLTIAGAFAAMHFGWGIGFLEGIAGQRANDGSITYRVESPP